MRQPTSNLLVTNINYQTLMNELKYYDNRTIVLSITNDTYTATDYTIFYVTTITSSKCKTLSVY